MLDKASAQKLKEKFGDADCTEDLKTTKAELIIDTRRTSKVPSQGVLANTEDEQNIIETHR